MGVVVFWLLNVQNQHKVHHFNDLTGSTGPRFDTLDYLNSSFSLFFLYNFLTFSSRWSQTHPGYRFFLFFHRSLRAFYNILLLTSCTAASSALWTMGPMCVSQLFKAQVCGGGTGRKTGPFHSAAGFKTMKSGLI